MINSETGVRTGFDVEDQANQARTTTSRRPSTDASTERRCTAPRLTVRTWMPKLFLCLSYIRRRNHVNAFV